ncbi:MAG: PP2C family serine/threonine-protein phosphatase [Xanthomonadales bacterium]|nr:PP2C family serine/threonine-protein phosphatase [Xanthomonadales bacterium]
MRFELFGKTDVGPVRMRNEDHVLVLDRVLNKGETYLSSSETGRFLQSSGAALWAAVADGVGGLPYGRDASSIALQTLSETLMASTKVPDDAASLRTVIEEVNERVVAAGDEMAGSTGIGTTLSGLFIRHTTAFVFNAGDSRVYRMRGDSLALLTRDDAKAGMIAETSGMSLDRAVETGDASLTNCVGMKDFQVTIGPDLECRPGDQFLICTDGLFGSVSRELIADVLGHSSPLAIKGHQLFDHALKGETLDNISLVLLACRPDQPSGTRTPRAVISI